MSGELVIVSPGGGAAGTQRAEAGVLLGVSQCPAWPRPSEHVPATRMAGCRGAWTPGRGRELPERAGGQAEDEEGGNVDSVLTRKSEMHAQ